MPSRSSVPTVRAVNLGGWLVVEGWIKPSLFYDIPNKDLLDGTQLYFKSVTTGKYLSAELGGGFTIVADKTKAGDYETFRLWRINERQFNFRVAKKQFVGLSIPYINTGNVADLVPKVKFGNVAEPTELPNLVVAVKTEPKDTEIFEIHRSPKESKRVRIKASNGCFLQARSEKIVTADYKDGKNDEWGDNDPSVFLMEINTLPEQLRGEYQLVNGYGTKLAPKKMKEHWDTFIVEEDFKFIKENGLNAVRIPVGWWAAHDANPPEPYVAGSLQYLDKAFTWAEKHGIKVIVDLHAAPGSQSGWEPSSSRDGEHDWDQENPLMKWLKPYFGWAFNEENIKQSLEAIEFFTARYARSPCLLGVELLNEPMDPAVSLDVLTDYYRRGYAAVRKYSSDAFVVMCDRLRPLGAQDPSELLPLAKELPGSVIDVHYYNAFEEKFKNMTVQQHIDYIKKERADELKKLREDGALMFIGEWSAAWDVKEPKKEDYKKFGEALLQVYGGGTFGWAYWTLKVKNTPKYNHWSLEWMIKNGNIELPQL